MKQKLDNNQSAITNHTKMSIEEIDELIEEIYKKQDEKKIEISSDSSSMDDSQDIE